VHLDDGRPRGRTGVIGRARVLAAAPSG